MSSGDGLQGYFAKMSCSRFSATLMVLNIKPSDQEKQINVHTYIFNQQSAAQV